MNQVEQRIAALQEEIATLEKTKQRGYVVSTDNFQRYDIDAQHIVLEDLEGQIIGIFVDVAACNKYLGEAK